MSFRIETMRKFVAIFVFLLLAACGAPAATPTPVAGTTDSPRAEFQPQRQAMVDTIDAQGLEDQAVLDAIGRVPRHEFVPDQYLSEAYENHPLPIGFGQTISQPYVVGLMTEELDVESGEKVLEVGTGSGYQAAVLAEMGLEVYSVEIIGELADRADQRLDRLGYGSVHVRHADGYFGWEQHAPYDAIIVTAAPDHVPQPLVQQLKTGAHMLVPVGPPGGYQELWKVTRVSEEEVESVSLGGVRFVPLVREDEQ